MFCMVTKRFIPFVILFLLMGSFIPVNANISSWGYQLQDFTVDELASSPYDLLVIDYSFDGSDESALTAEEVGTIQATSKTAVSYISIGEAEDYRYYFDKTWISNPPSWFDGENPDWKGNYKVKYWDSEWQSIIFDYLDKIISANFNGVYLDIIDAYEFYEDTVPDAGQKMIDFVGNISSYCKSKSTFGQDFLIIPQNGDPLLQDETYLSYIDGIGREDVYIVQDTQKKRDTTEITEIESNLDLVKAANKLVLIVDYSNKQDLITFARESAQTKGYLHYIGTLDLNKLLPPDYSGSTDNSSLPFPMIFNMVGISVVALIFRKRTMLN